MKTCTGGCCSYRFLSGMGYGCNYDGYCDYQLPRDSRPYFPPSDFILHPIEEKCYCAGQIGNDGKCLICGLRKQ